jgi:hypothetical protein
MPDWMTSVETFLTPWRSVPEVDGALVCGSYVTGNPSARSDIDVHIILSEGTRWRERGNRIVQSHMIEYFVNPPSQVREYFRGDHRANSWMAMVQFASGQIMFDNAGEIARLKAEAAEWMDRPFEVHRDPPAVEIMKYGLWDTWDNVRDAFERQSADLALVHHTALTSVFRTYSRYVGWHLPSTHQIYGLLTNAACRSRYGIPPFPDTLFTAAFQKAAQATAPDDMMAALDVMVEHVMRAMGGFEVDGWSSRSEIT